MLGDRYRIEAPISTGEQADAYFCHDPDGSKNKLVARVFHPRESEKRNFDSLSRELSLLCRIRHTNLARIVNFGMVEETSDYFLIEEHVVGKDLYAATEGMDARGILKIAFKLFQTIQFLHSREIIHGDLRPAHALLSGAQGQTEGDGLKLICFGLANWFRNAPQNGIDGSLAYTAPEILMGGKSTRSSDLYALGILIYLLLARRLPFDDEDPGFLTQKQLQGSIDLRPIKRLKNGIALSQLMSRLLVKDPAKRCLSAGEAVQLIRNIMGVQCPEMDGDGLGSHFSASRLIGRDGEMAFLRECAARVRASCRGWTVFIAGEAGSGKTRCMEELKSWAQLDGWRVVEGECRLREEGSYGPYRQILQGAAAVQGEEIFRFGDMPRIAPPGTFDNSLEYATGQFRDLLTRELVRRLSDRPTLLLLHDFHWADEATAAVLDYLSSDIQAHPVLACVSFRSGEKTGNPVEKVVESALRQQRGEVVALEPLTRESVAEFVSSMTAAKDLKESLGEWIFHSVGGNPFFLEEMLKHLAEQGVLQSRSARWIFVEENLRHLEAPAGVGAVLRRRIEQISPFARETASWLALFHRAVPVRSLSSIMARTPDEISESLHELSRRQMVQIEIRDSETVAEFRHALISEVIRTDLPGRKRRRMHCRIAEVLEQEGAAGNNLQELTMHCIQGNMGEKAVRYAVALAARARAEFAHENALRCFECIFRDRRGLTAEELCRAAIEASDTMFALGRSKSAVLLLKSEMRKNMNIGAIIKARMFVQLALSYSHLGDFSIQESCCKKGLKLVKNQSGSEVSFIRATLWAELAFGAILQSHPRRGLPFLDRALQSISGSKDAALTGRIRILAAFLHRITCKLDQALVSARNAVSILNESMESPIVCSALSTFGTILMALGRYPLALEKHRQAVLLSEKNRSVTIRSQVLANLAECLCRMGRTQEALDAVELAGKAVGESNNPAIRWAFQAILAEVRLADDDYKGAGEAIDWLAKSKGYKPALHTVGHAHFIAASYFFHMGLFDEALESIDSLARNQSRETPFYEYEMTEALRARILFERGSVREAMDRLDGLDRSAAKKRWPYHRCILKLQIAELLLARQSPALALKHARNALRLAAAMDSISLNSQARLLLGRIYSRMAIGGGHESAAHIDRAARELELSCQMIESAGHGEIAILAQYELCMLKEKFSGPGESLSHAHKAYELLCKMESRISPDMLASYYGVFGRAQIKQDLVRRLESDKEAGAPEEDSQGDEKARVLMRVSAAVNSIQDLDPLLEAILDQLICAMGMQRALVYLADEITGKLRLAKGRSHRRESLEGAESVSQTLLEEVRRQAHPIVSANLCEDPRMPPGGSGRVLCAPLKAAGRVLGLLYADHPMPAAGLSESAINLFAAFCNLSAIAIDNAVAHELLLKEKQDLERFLARVREGYREIVGTSACVEALRNKIALAAQSPLDILIAGESGTGKELVARAIHRTGRRSSAVFVPVDCGSLSDSLAEAELFGYCKGAFTGAAENRKGLLEAAHGGTIFLDEISNLPFRLQAKFLRVLQEREVRRIGETAQRKIDIQVVAATNRYLLEEIRKGRFRADLYYRLKTIEIRVPPLRERPEDIPLLIQWFLEKTAETEGGRFKRFSPEAMELLNGYPYPGNIRELKNAVASSYYSTSGAVIGVKELPVEVRRESPMDGVSAADAAARIYREILESRGDFEGLVKEPFLKHRLSLSTVRKILQMALRNSGGRYRKAFSLLKVPESRYSSTMQFLKRNQCRPDFRLFRRPA